MAQKELACHTDIMAHIDKTAREVTDLRLTVQTQSAMFATSHDQMNQLLAIAASHCEAGKRSADARDLLAKDLKESEKVVKEVNAKLLPFLLEEARQGAKRKRGKKELFPKSCTRGQKHALLIELARCANKNDAEELYPAGISKTQFLEALKSMDTDDATCYTLSLSATSRQAMLMSCYDMAKTWRPA